MPQKHPAKQLVERLIQDKCSLATAESCTGGRIAAFLTAVPGVSEVYWGGWVTYAPEAKRSLLGVKRSLLAPHRIVSESCARALAEGARAAAKSDFALGITGWAGPTRTPGQPDGQEVGLAYVALASSRRTYVHALRSPQPKSRTHTQDYFARAALKWVHQIIAKETAGTALPKRRSPRVSRNSNK